MAVLALRSGPSGSPAVSGPLLRGPRLAWCVLFMNVMAFPPSGAVIPLPGTVGQLITQAALPVALVVALLANPAGVVRPTIFLGLLSVMAVASVMVSVHSDFMFGSTYRAMRLLGFVLVLWLLTPWWGRPDLPLLRAHLFWLRVVLGSVVLGAVVAPGVAFNEEGRLIGTIWPIPSPQVAHYAAVLVGCTVTLWFCRLTSARSTLVTALLAVGALLATHTRTALLGLGIGLSVAGGSLFVGHVRVRRTSAAVVGLAAVGWVAFAPLLVAWFSRGQTAQDLSQLTGRTKVWSMVAQLERPWPQEFFGFGLSNKTYRGLAVDSSWVAGYLDQGWFGVALQATFVVVLVLIAVTRPAGPRRAVALFLVLYCIVVSLTETGLSDASPYLLDLTVAAALLATPPTRARGPLPTVRPTEDRGIGGPYDRSP